jgi:signal transduction histidine kinase
MRVLASILAVVLLLLRAVSGLAQSPSATPVTVAEVNRVLQSPAEQKPRPLVFHGVVIQWSPKPRGAFLQEGRAGIFVRLARDQALPGLGDELEVTARAQYVSTGPDTEIDADSVRIMGHPGFPAPTRCSLAESTTGQYNRLAVEVEGTVLHTSRHFGVPWLMLTDASGAAMAGIHVWPADWKPDKLLGQRVRIRGVAAGVWYHAVRCTTPDDITVLEGGAAAGDRQPFDSIAQVLAYNPAPGEAQLQPVLLRGVCTRADATEKQFALHDGKDGLLVSMPAYDPSAGLPSPGDEVSLTGVAASAEGLSRVMAWTVDVVGRREVPAPAPTTFAAPRKTLRELIVPSASRERVVVSGVVTCVVHSGGQMILMIEDSTGAAFVYDSETILGPGTGKAPLPKLGDRVEVEGIHTIARPSSAVLFEAFWRITGHEALPEAPLVPMAQAMALEYDCRRVRVQGRLVDFEQFVEHGRNVSRVWLRSGDVVTYGNFLSDAFAPAPAKMGQLVEITGVCNISRVAPNVVRSYSVQLNSMADARALPEPPPWSDPATRRLIYTIVGALVVVLAWSLLLRRQVRLRTAALELRETQLRQALAQEQELSNLKTNFISMVSHEFRTPLNVIVTSSDILSRYFDRLPPEERAEHLGSIHKSIQRMAGMMDDVLLLGRFDAGQQNLQPAELHLTAWCRRFPIELTLGNFEPIVRADENILRHILANLVSNAVKYSPAGAPVDLRVEQQGRDAVFTVTDHGIGIPMADRQRLFESFQRGGNVGQISGTGLGLVVVKRGVDLHGGTVAFTSEEGTGTTFTVHLPIFDEAKSGAKP